MWYEAFVITATASGFLGFLVYILLARIPSQEDLLAIGMAVVDAKLKDFNLAPPGPGGRKQEGFLGLAEMVMSTPWGQQLVEGFVKTQTGTGGYIRP